MRLTDLHAEPMSGFCQLSAAVHWEQSDRPTQHLDIEVPANVSTAPVTSPAAFFPIAAVAAHVHGEERLAVDGAVDPALVAGVLDAAAMFDSWDGRQRPPLTVEVEESTVSTAATGTSALLVTGGVDSTATLIENHARFGPGHPHRITYGLVVYGLDDSTAGDPLAPDDFLAELADAFGIELGAVRTNVRELDPSVPFWWNHAQSATWSSVAHALWKNGSDVWIGSDDRFDDYGGGQMRGSHPLLNPCFSSASVRMRHGATTLTRRERLSLIANSSAALQRLQVCNRPRATWRPLNCGSCEKCLRTMLCLAGLGVLDQATSFPAEELDPEAVRSIRLGMASEGRRVRAVHSSNYRELLPLLESAGRADLARAVRHMLKQNALRALRRTVRAVTTSSPRPARQQPPS